MKANRFLTLSAPFLVLALVASCDSGGDATSSAYRVASRTQLIGGPTALGEVGDYLLENDKIRVVVQDKTYNRGSGVFGGSLIDADLKRYETVGGALGGVGRDTFGELFPVFFLEMIDPESVSVVNDGSDGKAAIVEVKGRGGEFITMLRYLNQVMINSYPVDIADVVKGIPANSDSLPQIEFTTRYILEPGTSHIRIESTMRNISFSKLEFPSQSIKSIVTSLLGLNLDDFRIPTGHVLGFGAKSKIFLPGVGYDLRFGLEDSYKTPVPLPGFPGLLTNVVASTTDLGVNYGFATIEDPETNFVYQRDKEGLYGGRAQPDDMLFLFYASGFGGVFSNQSPTVMAPSFCTEDGTADEVCGKFEETQAEICRNQWQACLDAQSPAQPPAYTFTNYFIIGDGDVASIYEELYRIRGIKAPTVQGQVYDEVSLEEVTDGNVLIYSVGDSKCTKARIVNQVRTNSAGLFEFNIAPGKYCFRTEGSGRPLGRFKFVEVTKSGADFLRLEARASAQIQVVAVDESGNPIPAKVSVVGVHEFNPGVETRNFLFDLSAGESWRASDLVPDTEDPDTRRFIEKTDFTGADGIARLRVRPSDNLTVFVSRGPEYSLFSKKISLKPGQTEGITAVLSRVVDTKGYVSGDFHIHAAGSIDSGLDLDKRIRSAAGEGLEIAVSTDHNYVTDYKPIIYNEGMEQYINSVVGLELTTFEAGHFNAFPLKRDLDSMSRGSITWQEIPPQQIFDALRNLAPEGGNIVQVNHPRTPILGYFYQHNVDAFDASVDLALNTSSGNDKLTATLVSPSGPAFIEPILNEAGEPIDYKTTFSWDFDAIEVFNGKHFEELRHYRMPYDKDATEGPYVLPAKVLASFRAALTVDFETDADLHAAVFEDKSPEEITAMTDTELEDGVNAWVLEQLPPRDTILCDGDDVVFPGVIDDWYNLLNYARPDGVYRKYAATGNSDSHKDRFDEIGYPRNYFYTGEDEPKNVTPQALVRALRKRHNIVTNGPFINMTVNNKPVGSEVSTQDSISLRVMIRAAEWVGADRFRVISNGEVVRGLTQNQSDDTQGWVPIELDGKGRYEQTFEISPDKDSWFVLEVEGDQNMFPVLAPQEIPPFNFDAVIGSLAGAFGFSGGVEGLEPNMTFAQTPFAFTNPIWVVVDGDGEFTPPNPPVFRCQDGEYLPLANGLIDPDRKTRAIEDSRLKAQSLPVELMSKPSPFERTKGETTRDLRMFFNNFGHQH